MENEKDCPHCAVSDETIKSLKESASQDSAGKKDEYQLKKEQKERERVNQIRGRKIKKIVYFTAAVILIAGLAFAGVKYIPSNSQSGPKITVFYSSTCSCCKEYITYLRAKGFQVDAKETNDAISIKEKYNVPEDMQGCHTSVIGGYVVEGMVPVQAIEKLLAEKPEIDGIVLPGMPENAPGMPGFNGSVLKVYALKNGVSSEFYVGK